MSLIASGLQLKISLIGLRRKDHFHKESGGGVILTSPAQVLLMGWKVFYHNDTAYYVFHYVDFIPVTFVYQSLPMDSENDLCFNCVCSTHIC